MCFILFLHSIPYPISTGRSIELIPFDIDIASSDVGCHVSPWSSDDAPGVGVDWVTHQLTSSAPLGDRP